MRKASVLTALIVPFLCVSLIAQNSFDQAAGTTGNSGQTDSSKAKHKNPLSLDLPNSLVVEGRDTKTTALTTGQKFAQVPKNFFNPFTFIAVGVEAGIDQAADFHHGYGQGAEGYGKRYGADLADTATGQLFGIGVYPSIFHTDPRYYRMGKGSFFSRTTYAGTRVLVTRTDSGRRILNFPEILASATSSGIARSYYPDDERTAGDFAVSMGTRIAFDAAYNFAKEFWPDVRKHLFGHNK
jgi:hypothetical protein